jgi:hypothetical protein
MNVFDLAQSKGITINGNKAAATLTKDETVMIHNLTTGMSCEWAYATFERIVLSHGRFKS